MEHAEQLAALADKDRWIDRLTNQRDHLDEMTELATVEGELRALATRLHEVDTQRSQARSEFESAEERAVTLRQRRDELDARLQSPTLAARDAQSVQDELHKVVALLDGAEDLEVAALLDLEPLEEEVAAIRSQAAPLAARRKALQEAIVALQASLDDELIHQRDERAQLRHALDGPWGDHYDQSLRRAGIAGAARVDQGRCEGCRVSLPPLDLERWHAGTPFLECPHCGRLLVPC